MTMPAKSAAAMFSARTRTAISIIRGRMDDAVRDIIIAALAGTAAWLISVHVLGHEAPIFAVVSAVVSLAPGLPSQGKQAVGLIIGMAIGILVGEAAFLFGGPVAIGDPIWLVRLTSAIMVSMLIAAGFGWSPVMPIQAGVSVVLVMAVGPQTQGFTRLADGAVGVALGLICSQLLLTPDPLRMLNVSTQAFMNRLAAALENAADGVANGDAAKAARAEQIVAAAWTNLRQLRDAVDAARSSARWSLRGRLMAGPVLKAAARQNRYAVQLFAHTLLLAESLQLALGKSGSAPQGLDQDLRRCASYCRNFSDPDHRFDRPPHNPQVQASARWTVAEFHVSQIERRLWLLSGAHARFQTARKDAAKDAAKVAAETVPQDTKP